MIIQVDPQTFKNLTKAELKVIDYINDNESWIPSLSITQLAKKTYTSTATVTRAIQKVGFSGISELKYQINNHQQDKKTKNKPINSILEKTLYVCSETINNLDTTDILKAVDWIKHSKRVLIFARGLSALVGREFRYYLQLMGYNVVLIEDITLLKNTHNIVHSDDLVFILTVKNSTSELRFCAQIIHEKGARLVVCTCTKHSSLDKYANILIHGHTEFIMRAAYDINMYSRIPLYIIINSIVEYLYHLDN